MPSVTVYTLTEFGECSSRGREVTAEEAGAVMEAETSSAEHILGRARQPYRSDLGEGYQVGTGDDASYAIVVLGRF